MSVGSLSFWGVLLLSVAANAAVPKYTCGDEVLIFFGGSDDEFLNQLDGADENAKFYVNTKELDYSAYVALDANCKGTTAADFQGWSANFDLGACMPHVTANDTHINYQYMIWQKPMLFESGSPAIARYNMHSLRFDCHYSREANNVTSENYIIPNIVHTHHFDGYNLHEGYFTYTFQFTQSDYDTALAANSEVDVDDWMYLLLTLDDGSADESNQIAFKECTAHSSPTLGASSLTYTLIEDYCVKDESWDEDNSIEMVISGSNETATMRVKSFVWNTEDPTQAIYITCDTTVCNPDAYQPGTETNVVCEDYVSTCASASTNRRRRRRRAVAQEASQVVTLMTGPVLIN